MRLKHHLSLACLFFLLLAAPAPAAKVYQSKFRITPIRKLPANNIKTRRLRLSKPKPSREFGLVNPKKPPGPMAFRNKNGFSRIPKK